MAIKLRHWLKSALSKQREQYASYSVAGEILRDITCPTDEEVIEAIQAIPIHYFDLGMGYTVVCPSSAQTAQQDLLEFVAPADAVVIILDMTVSQSTEVGDAQEEGLNLLVKRGQTTSGTGGATVTPAALEFGFAAAGGVYERNNTTKATTGTITTHFDDNWNVRTPHYKIPLPGGRLLLSPSQRGTLELATTPADSITLGAVATIREIGG